MNAASSIIECIGLIYKIQEKIKGAEVLSLTGQMQSSLHEVQQDLIRLEEENANARINLRELESEFNRIKEKHEKEKSEINTEHLAIISGLNSKFKELEAKIAAQPQRFIPGNGYGPEFGAPESLL